MVGAGVSGGAGCGGDRGDREAIRQEDRWNTSDLDFIQAPSEVCHAPLGTDKSNMSIARCMLARPAAAQRALSTPRRSRSNASATPTTQKLAGLAPRGRRAGRPRSG